MIILSLGSTAGRDRAPGKLSTLEFKSQSFHSVPVP